MPKKVAESTRGIPWTIVTAEDRCGRCGLREGAGHTQYVGQGSRRGRAAGGKQVRRGVISAAAKFFCITVTIVRLPPRHLDELVASKPNRSSSYKMLNFSRLASQLLGCIHHKSRPLHPFTASRDIVTRQCVLRMNITFMNYYMGFYLRREWKITVTDSQIDRHINISYYQPGYEMQWIENGMR